MVATLNDKSDGAGDILTNDRGWRNLGQSLFSVPITAGLDSPYEITPIIQTIQVEEVNIGYQRPSPITTASLKSYHAKLTINVWNSTR